MIKSSIPVCYGYQGKGNIGDNLMFLLNTSGIDRVYVKQGRKVRPSDIELAPLPYAAKLLSSEKLLFSGGNIFNVDRWRSWVKIVGFYLLVQIRRVMGKETAFHSIGINKNTPPLIRDIAIRTILSANYAHLRETSIKSSNLWQLAGDAKGKVAFKPDVVFTGDLEALEQIRGFRDRFSGDEGQGYAVYFPSVVARHEARRQASDAPAAITLPEGIKKIYFIIQTADDAKVRPDFFAGKKIVPVVSGTDNIDRILALVIHARLVVTERYHGAILAKRFGVPMITSDFSEKLRHIEMING